MAHAPGASNFPLDSSATGYPPVKVCTLRTYTSSYALAKKISFHLYHFLLDDFSHKLAAVAIPILTNILCTVYCFTHTSLMHVMLYNVSYYKNCTAFSACHIQVRSKGRSKRSDGSFSDSSNSCVIRQVNFLQILPLESHINSYSYMERVSHLKARFNGLKNFTLISRFLAFQFRF